MNFSDKITKALCYVYFKKIHDHYFDSDLCSYMYYWIGDKIYANTDSKAQFTKIMKMIYQMLNNTDNYIICSTPNYEIDKNTFYKNKILFDFSRDYDNIKIHTAGYTTCDVGYKKYIDNYIRVYKDEHSYCNEKGREKYDCENFFSLFEEKQYKEISSFICMEPQNDRKILDLQREYKSHEPVTTKHFPRPTATTSTIHHRTPKDSSFRTNHISGILKDPIVIEPPSVEDIAEGSSSKTIAGSVAPVLGVSSISLLLYKVTPLGGFIRNFLGRNRNMYNPVEYMDSFNPYNDGIDPGGRTMNISYHRL
ncbi:Plasmodium vivax Vir protein, putative [Plasmodium vivax]|uniref:Vir protein, putative n=1 Tax=Plasmodium vivax TaxID=5855 RepID=A0A1G4E1T0_PLAVI|nr:Plasmodium vivax Vir protein, putative [Plasmodium vivax]